MRLIRNILIILTLFAFSIEVHAGRRDQILGVIDLEINELGRLSRVKRGRDPELLLRIAELYLEKGRILRESENEKFFSYPLKDRRRIDKKRFFSKSKSYITRAQSTGLSILKRFKNFRAKGEVYYILAFNAKENFEFKKAKSLFLKAIKSSKRGSRANSNARMALADMYYRDGDNKKANAYYSSAIRNFKKDKWYTKYLYNYSWTNYRLGKRKTALKQMKQVNSLSKNNKYVDKSSLSSRDIGYFYADMGDLKSAKKFYKKSGGDSAKRFYEMGLHLKSKQKYSKSLKMFESAFLSGDNETRINSLVQKLEIYEKYRNNRLFLQNAKRSLSLPLNETQKREVNFWVTKRAAILQKELSKSHNKARPKVHRSLGNSAAGLYLIARRLDPKIYNNATYYAAESYFITNQVKKALPLYKEVVEKSPEGSRFFNRAVVGMLFSINNPKVGKKNRRKYFEFTYVNYLKQGLDDKKRLKAIEKLFSFYVNEIKDIKKAEQIFVNHAKNYPKRVTKNELMIGRIVDAHKRSKDKKSLFAFVDQVKTLGVPLRKRFLNSLSKIVLITQFDSVQKANRKGDKVYALRGYLEIYRDKDTSVEAKRNSAYNISVLFYELGNIEMMNKWAQRAIELMSSGEVKKFYDSYFLMAIEMFLRHRLETGYALSEKLLDKVCRYNIKDKVKLLSTYITLALSDDEDSRVNRFWAGQKKCALSKANRKKIAIILFDHFVERKNISGARSYYKKIRGLKVSYLTEIEILGRLIKIYKDKGQKVPNAFNKRLAFLYKKVKRKNSIPLVALDEYAQNRMWVLDRDVNKLNSISLKFPQKTFDSRLKKKFNLLKRLTDNAINILEVGSGRTMVKVYDKLIQSYEKFVNEINNFTPPGKSAGYIKSFKASMKGIITPFNSRIRQFSNEQRNLIFKNDVLSLDYGNKARNSVNYVPQNDFVIMDKRGR